MVAVVVIGCARGRKYVLQGYVFCKGISQQPYQRQKKAPVTYREDLGSDESVERTRELSTVRIMMDAPSRSSHGLLIGRLVDNSRMKLKLIDVFLSGLEFCRRSHPIKLVSALMASLCKISHTACRNNRRLLRVSHSRRSQYTKSEKTHFT